MTVGVTYFQKDGFAFKPESICFGDGNSLEIKINRNGTINVIPITKNIVTLTLEGATNVDLVALQNKRDNNIFRLINGSATGEDINILGYIIPNALLTRVTPSAPITVNGFNIFDK